MPEPADRIATDVLRLARDPVSGRIRHASMVDIAVRAALLADLAMRGRLTDVAGAPDLTSAGPTGDRILDAVRSAVDRRPDVMWRRWFHHVSADSRALRNELLADGRWHRKHRWPPTFTETDSDAVIALAQRLDEVANYQRAPEDTHEAVLATLATLCGATGKRPRPSAVRQDLGALVGSMQDRTVRVVMEEAADVMRRARYGASVR